MVLAYPFVTIARRELYSSFRNHWFLLISVILLILAASIVAPGFSISGGKEQPEIRAVLLSLIHLQMYTIPLLALILSYDGILAERERGGYDLLRSYPIRYLDLLLGKWLGALVILLLALIIGFSFPLYERSSGWPSLRP